MKFDGKFITLNVALVSFFGIIAFFVSRKMISERKAATLANSFVANETSTARAKVFVVTRVHRGTAESLVNANKVVDFVKKTLPYSTKTIICIDIGNDLEDLSYATELQMMLGRNNLTDRAHILKVTPWGKFTHALNAAVQYAVQEKMEKIVFQSMEVTMDSGYVHQMYSAMDADPNILVVGPALAGHEFDPLAGRQKNTGRTCPWNTFAVWSLRYLPLTGFILVSDGMGFNYGGVEEVVTIAVQQVLRPRLKAVLVQSKSQPAVWNTVFEDPQREQWHAHKMKTKISRSEKQLEMIGLARNPGHVEHIEIN